MGAKNKKERFFHEELRPVFDEIWSTLSGAFGPRLERRGLAPSNGSIKNNIHFFLISVKTVDQIPLGISP
jgi:hypothetical protein